MIEVSKPKLEVSKTEATLSCAVTGGNLADNLWFSYPARYADFISENCADWVIAALLAPAMAAGEDLRVSGRVSPLFLLSVRTDLQHILSTQNSTRRIINIEAEDVSVEPGPVGIGVGTGFSAGIDSFATLGISRNAEANPITHLATFNVGAMGAGKAAETLFHRYQQRLENFCEENGFQSLSVNSNLADFYTGKALGFQQTHTIRGSSVILPIQKLMGSYFYSSTFEYRQISVKPTYDMSYADPILLPLLSTENTQFMAIGTPKSRLDKVRLVADLAESYRHLDICVDLPERRASRKIPNCSKCWKCGRQLLSLELLGKLEHYENVFDLQVYFHNKSAIIDELVMNALSGDRPNEADVLTLAQSLGKLPSFDFSKIRSLASISWKVKRLIAMFIVRRLSKSLC